MQIDITTGIKNSNNLNRVIGNSKCNRHVSFKTDQPNTGIKIVALRAAMRECYK